MKIVKEDRLENMDQWLGLLRCLTWTN